MQIYSQDSTRVLINDLISNPVEQEKEDRSQLSYCFAKLGFQHLFHQKGHQLIISYLGSSSKPYSYKHFTSAKQIYEKGIKRFKSLYCSQQGDNNKRRRRGYSIDNDVNGAYYLNNWLSHEEYLCQKPVPDEKTAHLVYQILGMRWSKALEIIHSLPRNAMTAAIEYILNGFKIISNLLNQQDKFFSQQFLARPSFEIKVKFSSQSVGGYTNFVNIFEQESRNRFSQIRNIPRKVQILKLNMDYLIKFVASNKFDMKDNYLTLALLILGNRIDQQQANNKQGDFLKILLNLDLRLPDRLNFATKLLNQRKRKEFCQDLQESLSHFPRIQNILFYISHPVSRHKQQKIQQICKCYLDQFLDLQTVAYLSLDFPFLKKYCLQFKQALMISSETKQLQRLENHLQLYKEKQPVRQQKPRKILRRNTNFLSCVNVSQEKINDYKAIGQSDMACEICSKKMFQTESYMECQKCRHGGHINHIIKWFQEYQHCPNIGCPCICN